MEVERFGLGIRVDMMNVDFGRKEQEEVFSYVFAALSPKLLAGLKLYAGRCKLDETDSDNVFTIVFIGGGLHKTRKLFLKLNNDTLIKSMLTSVCPYIQTNVLCKIEGLTYYGVFGPDGVLLGGDIELDTAALRSHTSNRSHEGKNITVLLAFDKFKGSMSAEFVVRTLMKAGRRMLPYCRMIPVPIADGGEGTVDALIRAFNGVKRRAIVTGPLGKEVEAEYGIIGGNTAVIEMAQASGLALLSPDEFDPMRSSSRGTGELIAYALNDGGVKHILMGIGGSATNDGGIGAAIALGARVLDKDGNELEGCGSDMIKASRIDLSGIHEKLKGVDIRVMCDVTNPLTGDNGATMIFGRQKGADESMLEILEAGMKNIEKLYNDHNHCEICSEPGTGAAGGMGAMLSALLGAKLMSGAEAVLEAVRFNELLAEADFVLTGEGRFDSTSINSGKAVGTVIRYAKERDVPVFVLSGSIGEDVNMSEMPQNIALASCIARPISEEYAMASADQLLIEAAERLFAILRLCK